MSVAVVMHQKMFPFINREKSDMDFIYGIANENVSETLHFMGNCIPIRETFVRLHRLSCKTRSLFASQSNARRAKMFSVETLHRTKRDRVVKDAILNMVTDPKSTITRSVASIYNTPRYIEYWKDDCLHSSCSDSKNLSSSW